MLGNMFRKLLQPLRYLRAGSDKVGVKSDHFRKSSPLGPARGQNLPPPWPRAKNCVVGSFGGPIHGWKLRGAR